MKNIKKTFGLIESMSAMSKASCRKLISKSKKEKMKIQHISTN